MCRDDCVLNEVVKRLRSIATGEDLLTEEERVVVDGARNWNTVRYGQDAQFLRCATRDLLAIIDRIAPAPTTTTDQ